MSNTVEFTRMAPVKDAAKVFHISPEYLRQLCRNGSVRFFKVSKTRWLVDMESLTCFICGETR